MNETFKDSIDKVYNDYPVALMGVYVILYLIAYPLLKKNWPPSDKPKSKKSREEVQC